MGHTHIDGLPVPVNAFITQAGAHFAYTRKRARASVCKRTVQALQLNGTMTGTSALPVIISLPARPSSGGKPDQPSWQQTIGVRAKHTLRRARQAAKAPMQHAEQSATAAFQVLLVGQPLSSGSLLQRLGGDNL